MINLIVPPDNTFGASRLIPYIRKEGIQCSLSHVSKRGYLNICWRTKHILDHEVQINTPSAIRENDNKRLTRLKLYKALPESAIKTYLPLSDNNTTSYNYPVVLRPDKHSQGKRLFVANTQQEMMSLIRQNPDISHAMPLLWPNKEFRCWCAKKYDGTVVSLKMQEKEATYDEALGFKPKNFHLGNAIFKYISDFKYKKTIRETAKNAMIYSPLMIAAVDVIFETSSKKAYILELNARYGINSDSTAEITANYLIEYYKDWKAAYNRPY